MASLSKRLRLNVETGKQEQYWMIQRRVDGRLRASAIGFVTAAEAQRALAMFEGDLARSGADPLLKTGPSCSAVRPATVGELWGWDLEPWQGRVQVAVAAQAAKSKTVEGYLWARAYIVRHLGKVFLTELTPAHGDMLITALREQDLGARSIQIVVDRFRKSIQLAFDDGLIGKLPSLRRPSVPRRVERPFHTLEQTELVLALLAAKAHKGRRQERRSWRAIWLAVSLGLRPGELRHLRWSRVDFSTGELGILPTPEGTKGLDEQWAPKAESARHLPLEPALLAMLREAWMEAGRPADGWVFENRDDPDRPFHSFKKGLATACTEAGVPQLSPHALRRTAATRWLSQGIDLQTVMRLGGWRTPQVLLEIYAQTNMGRQREALIKTAVASGVKA